MAAATTSIVMGGLALGQTASGIIGKSRAKKDLRNLKVPELENAFEDIPISTLGSGLIREEAANTTANLIDASRSGGVRSVASSLPKIQALNNEINQGAMKYLDDQVIERNYNIAQDNTRIRNMVENRYLGDVQGLNNEIQAQNQNIWSGLRGLGNVVAYSQRAGLFDKKNEVVNSVGQIEPYGNTKLTTEFVPYSDLPTVLR